MKIWIVSLILLFSGLSYGLAQRKISIYEDFKEVSPAWESSQKSNRGRIKGQKFLLANEIPTYSLTFTRKFDLHPEMDFIISARVKQTNGPRQNNFGLIIADLQKTGHTNWHYFLISGEQQHKVYFDEAQTRKRIDVTPWISARGTVKPRGNYNVLTVKKIEKTIQFSINGNVVHRMENMEIGAQAIGFLIQDIATFEIDHLEVTGFLKINELPNARRGIEKFKLGPNVNSSFHELQPVMSYDEKVLYFVRFGHPKNQGFLDDIWLSRIRDDYSLTKARNIGVPLNTRNNNYVIATSESGDSLFLGNSYHKIDSRRIVSGDGLSVSYKKKGRWTMPENITIQGFDRKTEFINYAFSQNKNVLISSVKREDTNGASDLYVSFKVSRNVYSEPQKMGKIINSPGIDTTPFLTNDGKTLYFSSDGHNGYGSNDVFVSYRLDDTWTNWSVPMNMGPEVNSKDWDGYYMISPQETYSFMVTGGDIYQVGARKRKIPKRVQPKVTVYGRVVNRDGYAPLPGTVTWYDAETDEKLGETQSNPKNGFYSVTLPAGKKYRFEASAEGFQTVGRDIDASKVKSSVKVKKHFILSTPPVVMNIPRGQSRGPAPEPEDWRNILFEYDKSNLLPESKILLDGLIKTLEDNPKLNVELKGHTDNSGKDNYNQSLSQRRTNAVIRYMTTRGISAFRIIGWGYGEKRPVANNQTEDGRRLNRRVEIRLIEDDVYKN